MGYKNWVNLTYDLLGNINPAFDFFPIHGLKQANANFLKRVHIKLNNKDKPAQHMEQNDELI